MPKQVLSDEGNHSNIAGGLLLVAVAAGMVLAALFIILI